MKLHIIAYRILAALGLFLFLLGAINLLYDWQLGSFQLISILFSMMGIVLAVFASIMVDHCKIVERTADFRARSTRWIIKTKEEDAALERIASDYKINTALLRTNEEIDAEVDTFLQDSTLSPKEKEAWRKGITAGARAAEDEHLARLIRKGTKGFTE